MKAQMRNNLTPQGYIRQLFAETKDGKVVVGYENPHNNFAEETGTLHLNWTAEDAQAVEAQYNLLTAALVRIAKLHDQLQEEEQAKALLSPSDFQVWNTYVRPYDAFEEDLSVVEAIWERAIGDLFEEEEEILKKYCMWEEEQSQKRIPFHRRSCANLIKRAMRYEKLVSLGAPELVVTEEGRCLAEEMVLYSFGKEQPIVWE